MSRGAVETFLRTLILGDFEEHQSTSAQIVSGLLGLIPGLDQVLDARDIAGTLFNINKSGGFKNATPDQLVNLGFAAFGAIPEVGSVFKATFKPLYRERKLAKGAVHSGLHALESMLGMGKGGALTWINKHLLGQWAHRTNQVIQTVNAALNSAIDVVEFMAFASGWKDWLIPDPIQELCKQLLPGLKAMRGQLNAPLQRASAEIKQFLTDLLGEQAAGVVMALSQRAVQASAVPATRARTGNNLAALQPKGKVPAVQKQRKVAAKPETQASKGQGPLHRTIQVTRKAFKELGRLEKGLVGEHMADYHELKRLGGKWPHDKSSGHWSPETIKKLNADKRPVNLSLIDLPKMVEHGIDAIWEHGGQYTVVEAKARETIFAMVATVKSLTNKGLVPAQVRALSTDLQNLWLLLTANKDVVGQGSPLVQMSRAWVADRTDGEQMRSAAASNALKSGIASRRVLLVTLESTGVPDHGQALADIHLGVPEAQVHPHLEHGISREWDAAEIDKVVNARASAHAAKQAAKAAKPPAGKPTKPSKTPRPGK
jgi:hypothetical protein